ncbi:hypothetical protein GMOD_00006970 [Pyrenophora seminiperda CCB06]|uniref:Uncharacterized protein n=1 Tax=Pyrenophora seminiperda CCB06 TaxID=1302712 RepID=A0A3M7MC96_9PLEO|nr:hypothetical protein GMOD_00006970 [Pyrenophora seminiperda CCB06]
MSVDKPVLLKYMKRVMVPIAIAMLRLVAETIHIPPSLRFISVRANEHQLSMEATPIGFILYLYLLVVLPILLKHRETIQNWLWWYPPHLRSTRAFRLRRFLDFYLIWLAMILPIVIIWERGKRSNPIAVQSALSGGS